MIALVANLVGIMMCVSWLHLPFLSLRWQMLVGACLGMHVVLAGVQSWFLSR